MRLKPLPCPICGADPEIDYGFSDAPFEIPLVGCQTVHFNGDETIACPMSAQGIQAWNYLVRKSVALHHAHQRVDLREGGG